MPKQARETPVMKTSITSMTYPSRACTKHHHEPPTTPQTALQTRETPPPKSHLNPAQHSRPHILGQLTSTPEPCHIDAGANPVDPLVQETAQRWLALMEDMTGGDREILSGMYAKMDGRGPEAATVGVVSADVWDYAKRAFAVGYGSPHVGGKSTAGGSPDLE
jgi:hypothetical protein